jgi:hypothetical protein
VHPRGEIPLTPSLAEAEDVWEFTLVVVVIATKALQLGDVVALVETLDEFNLVQDIHPVPGVSHFRCKSLARGRLELVFGESDEASTAVEALGNDDVGEGNGKTRLGGHIAVHYIYYYL